MRAIAKKHTIKIYLCNLYDLIFVNVIHSLTYIQDAYFIKYVSIFKLFVLRCMKAIHRGINCTTCNLHK